MDQVRRAVIDVGTNSVKVLVADILHGEVKPVLEESKQTRLGQGFYATGVLQSDRIVRTAQAVAEFARRARAEGAAQVKIIATSAAREAANRNDLGLAIQDTCGLPLEIISGDREADLAYRGVATASCFTSQDLMIVDVGGGSTEFILGDSQRKRFSRSCLLGTVRLLEAIGPHDPPLKEELTDCRARVIHLLEREIALELSQALGSLKAEAIGSSDVIQLVGSGGTASILGCIEAHLTAFDRNKLESTRISLQQLREHVARLWALPLEERQKIPGLPPNRADVILTGAVIYQVIMEQFGFNDLRITTRGLRFGAVLQD